MLYVFENRGGLRISARFQNLTGYFYWQRYLLSNLNSSIDLVRSFVLSIASPVKMLVPSRTRSPKGAEGLVCIISVSPPRPPNTKSCQVPCPCCINYVFIIPWSRECRLSTVSISKCVNNIPSKYFYLITENYAFSYPQVSHYVCLNYEKYAFNKSFVISIHAQ